MKDKLSLPPSAVVLDLILRWSRTIGNAGTATVNGSSLIFAAKNHRGVFVVLSTPVHFDGEPEEGPPPRFVLFRLGPGVWKLAPSVLTDVLHAYLTLVDVPEPPPWESR
jgi:hypothetical protein